MTVIVLANISSVEEATYPFQMVTNYIKAKQTIFYASSLDSFRGHRNQQSHIWSKRWKARLCAIYGFKITAVCKVTLSYICLFCMSDAFA